MRLYSISKNNLILYMISFDTTYSKHACGDTLVDEHEFKEIIFLFFFCCDIFLSFQIFRLINSNIRETSSRQLIKCIRITISSEAVQLEEKTELNEICKLG